MAKNTLLNALKKYSVICSTVPVGGYVPSHGPEDIVQSLIRGAERASMILKETHSKISNDEIDGDIDKVAEVLTRLGIKFSETGIFNLITFKIVIGT